MPSKVVTFPEPPLGGNGVIMTPELVKAILDEIIRQSKFSVASPLMLSDGPEGRSIRLLSPKPAPAQSQHFIVRELAPLNEIDQISPFVIANTYTLTPAPADIEDPPSYTQGTRNYSVGTLIPHQVGDVFLAIYTDGAIFNDGMWLGQGSSGTTVGSSSWVINWVEKGEFGIAVTLPIVQVGGSNGSSGFCTFTYDVKDPSGTTTLVAGAEVEQPRSVPGPMTAATFGRVYMRPNNIDIYRLQYAYEKPSNVHICETPP